jgi:putative transposase
VTAPQRREGAGLLKGQGVSERRACQLVGLSRSVLRYHPASRDEDGLVERIRLLAAQNPRYGYLRIWALLQRERRPVKAKRVHRFWKKLKLQVPRRRKKKRYKSSGQVPLKAEHPNHVWTWDFIHDTTADGRNLKSLTVSDEFTREGLAIQTRRCFPASRVVEVMERLIQQHGAPLYMRSDNGPEFVAQLLKQSLQRAGIGTHYITLAECLWRKLQRQVPRRMPEHGGVLYRSRSAGRS